MNNTVLVISVISLCFVSILSADAQPRKKRQQSKQKTEQPQSGAKKQSTKAVQSGKSCPIPQNEEATQIIAKSDFPSEQIKRIGVVFNKVSTRFLSEEVFVLGLGNLFEKSTSSSDQKLPVVIFKSAEEASKAGMQLIYSVEYVEEKGKYFDRGLVGYATNILFTVKRLDQTQVTTNWDNLNVRKTDSDFKFEPGKIDIIGGMAELQLYQLAIVSFAGSVPLLRARLTDRQFSQWSQNAEPVFIVPNSNQDLLYAASKGDTTRVEALLANGADVNARDDYGRTALMFAVVKGEVQTAQSLLAKRADVDSKDEKDWTAALMLAGMRGNIVLTEALLAQTANIDAKNRYGDTALLLAVRNGHTAVVRALLAKGANASEKNHDGKTALALAERCPAIVQLLKRAGAKL